MRWLYTLFIIILYPTYSFAQEFSYSRYDSKEGLAGSTVYCLVQDRDGFMWFGTETGLSRFDGTHFRNFTREDGLPDNDIIQLFADTRGRVWISPFKKTICYYYKGIIHSNQNDTLIKKLNIQDNVMRFTEDVAGNILLQEKSRLHLIQTNGQVSTILRNGDKPLEFIELIAGRKEGGFWVLMGGNLYALINNRFTFWRKLGYNIEHFTYAAFTKETFMWRSTHNEMATYSLPVNKQQYYPFWNHKGHINVAVIDDHFVASCSQDGAFVYNIDHPDSIKHYLPGIPVSNMMKDTEGNWWFCTFGNGIYRLNSAVAQNQRFRAGNGQDFQVLSFIPYNNWILAGSRSNAIHKLSMQTGQWKGSIDFLEDYSNTIYAMNVAADNRVILGTRNYVTKLSADLKTHSNIIKNVSVKALCPHGNVLLVGTDKSIIAIDPGTFKILDTIWHERATCLYSDNKTIYIGTINGLYTLDADKKIQYLGDQFKEFRSRIVAITEDENQVVWVATSDNGVVAWRNDAVVLHLTRQSGLSSNICRALFLNKGNLWVGTNKGLNKVNVLVAGSPIQKYSTSDGLSSDFINTVYVADKKVFVGTPEGVTFFDEEKMASQSRCDLRFIDITVGGQTYYSGDAPSLLPHEKNNIQFNYVGISYKSGGDIRYRYRLCGLDSAWRETRETNLNYPTLPSGDYQLQLQAINKFDVNSKVLVIRFTIEKLLYEKTWFRILMGFLFLAVTGLVIWLIIRRIRKREQEKTAISKRISELEQLSRKAQMNPHFIFNSLNSIQQYVMDADVVGANKFISGFSRLIRQTLDFSSKPEISLEEELDYLTNYLAIERTRLENAFSWAVQIDDSVNPAEYYIPPMILQPFVENSVRHGLRFRRDKEGLVTISVKREGDHLICILEDNGVGRKAAMHYKSISPINYQSKGMSLTADRIAMFNKEHEHKISMQIDDLKDSEQNALGTRVTISFPVL
jgi:ligand-binding sensor domain-containing protein